MEEAVDKKLVKTKTDEVEKLKEKEYGGASQLVQWTKQERGPV